MKESKTIKETDKKRSNKTGVKRNKSVKARQLDMFAGSDFAKRIVHGGAIREGKRKLARPVVTKTPMHIVMRASRAQGAWSLMREKNYNLVNKILRKMSRKYDIRIHHFVNVGNHLHLVVQTRTRDSLSNFMREFAGTVAMRVTGARKGLNNKFWDATYFSRVIRWGQDLKGLVNYVAKNFIESRAGFWVDIDEIIVGKRFGFG